MVICVYRGQPGRIEPVCGNRPRKPAIGAFPDVDAAAVHHVGVVGGDGQCQIVPTLPPCGRTIGLAAQNIGCAGTKGKGLPTVGGRIKTLEAAGTRIAAKGTDKLRIGRRYRQGNAVASGYGQHDCPSGPAIGRTADFIRRSSINDGGVAGFELKVVAGTARATEALQPCSTSIGRLVNAIAGRYDQDVGVYRVDQHGANDATLAERPV